ncbi:MAG: DivIVA domain-containing protein [Clostridia bacterium]|nr:DivIVA domain-containing protein [Clostridia bacterium]
MIKAENIAQKEFHKALYGYDCEEVDSFLDELILQMRQMEQERLEMATTIEYLVGQLQQRRHPEPEGDPFVAPAARKQLLSRTGRMRLAEEALRKAEPKAKAKAAPNRETGSLKVKKPKPHAAEPKMPSPDPVEEPEQASEKPVEPAEAPFTEPAEPVETPASETIDAEAAEPVEVPAPEAPEAEAPETPEAPETEPEEPAAEPDEKREDEPVAPLPDDNAHEA